MTAPIQPIMTPAELGDNPPIRLKWTKAPLNVGDPFDVLTCRFDIGNGQAATIDIGGPTVYLSRCGQQGFQGGFANGDSVLLGDNLSGTMPIHVIFDVPVRGGGAHVSVFTAAPWGAVYTAQLFVRLDGQTRWWPVAGTLMTSQHFGTAPFLGALVDEGQPGIRQFYFDATGDSNRTPPAQQIAINDLLFIDE